MAFDTSLNQKKGTPWYIDPNNPMQANQGYTDLIDTGLSGMTAQDFQSKLSGFGNQFGSTFKQLTGKEAGADDFNKYFGDLVRNNIFAGGKGFGATNYADVQNLVNPYIQNQYGDQVQGYQQQQQQSQQQQGQKQIQDLINSQNQSTQSNLTNPQNIENLRRSLNGSGILNEGTFSQALGNTLGQGANANQSAALGEFGLPAIGNQYQTAGAPYQSYLGNMNQNLQGFGRGAQGMFDFGQQSNLAQQLQHMMSPSALQQWAPIISGALQGGGAAAGGAAAGTSYVCLELIRRGLAIESDLDLLHLKIMPAMFKKGRAFWIYAMDAGKLVDAANRKGIDWKLWRKRFLDNVIAEENPLSAVNVYALACRDLAMECDASLWDERALRVGYWDSLPFLPRLFSYRPFLKALVKVARMRLSFLCDVILSEVRNA